MIAFFRDEESREKGIEWQCREQKTSSAAWKKYLCKVDGCQSVAKLYGYCEFHYETQQE